ncbi:hypothetical protein BS47DRAFT_1371637 [Hydnum rufescens UP504]|uniref:3-oxo-5-alpha-steroid 4-dehydrogenase C-terminal domain-containing protein n=1 Tax=Hydnum rufescens UP504 TaxID=1448309 RepID=A0A9P6DZ48_9AGAM|nr:hypothetical protein BS47DRAFT_1371637 [Hydnum rufescens UP504]
MLNVNGQLAWMIMELPAPVLFLASYHTSRSGDPEWSHPTVFMLLALFTGHYVNRAVVSPLRTPSRSPSHVIVPICAIIFNTMNASLMGTFFAFISNSPPDLTRPCALPRSAQFWMGIIMFILGLVSNVWHDEILLRLRKNPDSPSALSHSTSTLLNKGSRRTDIAAKPKYSIPYGGLYRFVSYPNYLSEWFEWLGFAIASSALTQCGGLYTPPWMFLAAELAVMLPRAIRGHAWYRERFGERYPSKRKAIFPALL